MDSEEPDYMSDDFLTSCVQEDIRPGLLNSRAKKREHDSLKRKVEHQQQQKLLSKTVFQHKTREEGLNKPIDSTNKGFALLQKMGYKPGTGIGKNESGRTEPVGITIKSDRKGLGRESALKEIKALKASFASKKSRIETVSVDDYRARLATESAERFANRDLGCSQRVCHELDLKEGTGEPAESWFWPPKDEPVDDDEKDDESEEKDDESEEKDAESSDDEEVKEYTVFEKLKLLTAYLRTAHLYCIWCGVHYESVEDLEQSCPGSTRDDH